MLWRQLRVVNTLKTNAASIRLFSTEKPPDDNVKSTEKVDAEVKETTHIITDKKLPEENTVQELNKSLESSNLMSDSKLDAKDSDKHLSQSKDTLEKTKLSGFAQAFDKFSHINDPKPPEKPLPFVTLLRQSEFMNLGDPEGKQIYGRIFKVIEDDLYIDFGWKFHCVCPRPLKNGEFYVRNSLVLLKIRDLELSTRFIGSTVDTTILEADCVLIRLVDSPLKQIRNKTEKISAKQFN